MTRSSWIFTTFRPALSTHEHRGAHDLTSNRANCLGTRQNICMIGLLTAACSLMFLLGVYPDQAPLHDQDSIFEWSTCPPVPPPATGGAFGGISGNKILLAGGSYFPSPEWSSDKVWSDRIITLVLGSQPGRWVEESAVLPEPCGYGGSISLPDGSILLMGGSNGTEHLSSSIFIDFTPDGISMSPGRDLPLPLAYMSPALVGDRVYLVGGIDAPDAVASRTRVFALDWSDRDSDWIELPPIPDSGGRILSATASHGGSLHVFGGCSLHRTDDLSLIHI